MKPTEDLLGGDTKKSRKGSTKAKKTAKKVPAKKAAKKAPAKAKAKKEAKPKRVKMTAEEKAAKKAEKSEARKAARAANRKDDRVPVDQTPKEVPRENKLNKASVDLLVYIHENTAEATASAQLATELKTDTKTVNARAKSLVAAGLLVKDDKAKTLDVVGKRYDNLTELFTAIETLTEELGHMPTAAAIGERLYADPKKPDKKDGVRFGRAAGRLLQGAFKMGIIRQFTQPRRKYSAEKTRTLYANVEK